MHTKISIITLTALLFMFTIGCKNHSSDAGNAPSRGQIKNQLSSARLRNVDVSVDSDKKLVTLTGKVESGEQKDHVAQIAQDAAAGWVIANEVSIEPQGAESGARKIESNIDTAIEHNFKALAIANHWDSMNLKYHAKNGVLTLEGTAPDTATRQDIEKIAATTPNVTQVVNKMDVKH